MPPLPPTGDEDKRADLRKTLILEGEVADAPGGPWFAIRLVDVSPRGIGFLTHEEVPLDATCWARFALPHTGGGEIVTGLRIIYCLKHPLFEGYRIGGVFTDLSAGHRDLLERFLG